MPMKDLVAGIAQFTAARTTSEKEVFWVRSYVPNTARLATLASAKYSLFIGSPLRRSYDSNGSLL